jgi:hypothetical protein
LVTVDAILVPELTFAPNSALSLLNLFRGFMVHGQWFLHLNRIKKEEERTDEQAF